MKAGRHEREPTDQSSAPKAELEQTWRHLMEPLGFGGHSLWLMVIRADGRVLPRLTQIEETVRPPTDEDEAAFVGS